MPHPPEDGVRVGLGGLVSHPNGLCDMGVSPTDFTEKPVLKHSKSGPRLVSRIVHYGFRERRNLRR